MAVRNLTDVRHGCGCVSSHTPDGRLAGFGELCQVSKRLFAVLIRNPKRNHREPCAERLALREHVGCTPQGYLSR